MCLRTQENLKRKRIGRRIHEKTKGHLASKSTKCPSLPYLSRLNFGYILGHGSSFVLFHIKLYALPISQRLESRRVDGRIMDKYVRSVFPFDKAKSFLFTKPFYCPFCQSSDLLSKTSPDGPNRTADTLTKERILHSETDPQITAGPSPAVRIIQSL
jgi:hypothetical protein